MMSERSSGLRYELKFSFFDEVAEIVRRFKRCTLGIREQYAARTVNNLYFDTDQFDCFKQHESGVSNRFKVRARSYEREINFLKGKFFIELKSRRAGCNQKYRLGSNCSLAGDLAQTLRSSTERGVSPSGRFVPKLLNRYDRMYFCCSLEKVRITIDQNIRAQRFDTWSSLYSEAGKERWSCRVPMNIVEVKFPSEEVERAQLLISSFQERRSRFSKYCYGVRRCFPHLTG